MYETLMKILKQAERIFDLWSTQKYSKVSKICSACLSIFIRVSYMFKPTVTCILNTSENSLLPLKLWLESSSTLPIFRLKNVKKNQIKRNWSQQWTHSTMDVFWNFSSKPLPWSSILLFNFWSNPLNSTINDLHFFKKNSDIRIFKILGYI